MLPFIPESPRFLMAKGRGDEAIKVLSEYHANGAVGDELVLYEVEEINAALAIESRYAEVGWNILWSSTANIKKMLLVLSVFTMCLWYVDSSNYHKFLY